MTTEKKIRSLILIIAFLIVTNIVMLLFFVFSKPCVHNPPPKDENLVATFLQNEIQFDEKQMDLYQNIRKNDFDKAKPAFEALRNAKNSFYQNIHKDDVPDSVIKKSASIIGKRQINVDMLMLKHFKNVRKLCTEQQLPKFDSLFKNVIAKITAGRFKKK
jgi:protein CpxP